MITSTVYHNHGRWVADCAADGCNVAWQVDAHTHTPPIVDCHECHTTSILEYPDAGTVTAVETALAIRPVPATRSWWPWETITDLHDQNRQKGLV